MYRLYLVEAKHIESSQFPISEDSEHTAHRWVPLEEIIASLQRNKTIEIENQITIAIETLNLYLLPEFYQLLSQQPILDNLLRLQKTHVLKLTRTQSHYQPTMRGLITPDQKKEQIIRQFVRKTHVTEQINNTASSRDDNTNPAPYLSQSELHLNALLPGLVELSLETKIRTAIECYFAFLSAEDKIRLEKIVIS